VKTCIQWFRRVSIGMWWCMGAAAVTMCTGCHKHEVALRTQTAALHYAIDIAAPLYLGMAQCDALAACAKVSPIPSGLFLKPAQLAPARSATLPDGTDVILGFKCGKLSHIEVTASARKAMGIGIGSTWTEVRQAFPGAVLSRGWEGVCFATLGPTVRLAFDGTVVRDDPPVDPSEHPNCEELPANELRVTRIEIRPDID
jgi:hypothetical protein